MNKKVLTLCAGFLLAGGMLSSVSAENISKLTEGKYYKIVRTWERSSNSGDHAGWTVMEAGYYLGATSMDTDATLWKAEKNADGTISLVNMEGERFTLESEGSSVSNFTIDYNPSDLGKDETDPDFNQFKFGTNGILAQAASKDENGVWKLVAGVDNSSDFTEVKPQAFDAEATNLQEVANANAMDFFTPSGNTYVADGKTYRTAITVTTNGTQETLYIDYIMLKAAYNQNTKVWSFTYNIDGKPLSIGGGGRYDNLVEEMGGMPTNCVGFAMGLDRIVLLLNEQNENIDVYLSNAGNVEISDIYLIANNLREQGFSVECNLTNKSLKKQFAFASKLGANFVCVLGDNEIKNKTITVKNLKTKQENQIELKSLVEYLKNNTN